MKNNPLEQFAVETIIPLKIMEHDLSFTNASLFMALAVMIMTSFFALAIRKSELVPGRFQAFAENIYNFTLTTLDENTHGKGQQFFPFIFSLFMFILALNLLGNAPYGFSVTSQLIITSALAFVVFCIVTITGFIKHGLKFLSLFLPEGTPWAMAPLIIVLEVFAYFVRPVALSIRLGANMIAGHILVGVIVGFIALMGIWGFLPISFIIVFDGFEIFVAILQAYIFTILTCVYLNDAINLH
ncbi:MAG: F0F1 ATP synthase subunit A [Rickettsiales bacterium]